ncbi:MAG: ribosomal-processing cysteine protease Prp [Lachnospiraceae bacterium]|nr:ribosomal-processing cysteine protease Prp [Lachnospiraceae bacterium]
MITVTVFVDSEGEHRGFRISGHAGYAGAGEDIVCAAVSALAQSTVNAIEAFTEDSFLCSVEDGYLECSFSGKVSKETKLLLNTLLLGLEGVRDGGCQEDQNGDPFIRIVTEEV